MIRKLEELSMNAFPATETLYYDGWIIRLSKGKSKRLNSVQSLYSSTIDLEIKIKKCEEIYDSKNLRKVFKITNQETSIDLDPILRNKGYKEVGRTSVQTIDLKTFHYKCDKEFEIHNQFSEEWFNDYCKASNKSKDDIHSFRNAWSNLIPEASFLSYKIDGQRVAFAMGVMEGGYGGVFGVLVKDEYRGRGYGKLITRILLNTFKEKGIMNSYLQVEVDNERANQLYKTLGYKEEYQYWYLLKEK